MKKYNKKLKQQAVELYQNGYSLSQICTLLDVSAKIVVSQWLKKANIKTRKGLNQHTDKYNAQDEILAVSLYKQGLSINQVKDLLHVGSTATIHKWLLINNIERRTEGAQRQYHANDDFFSSIDTEEKAYILGFITGDGHVCESDNYISIEIKSTDYALLDKIIIAMNSNNPIRTYTNNKGHETAQIRIYSKQIVNNLVRLGLTHNKTWNVQPAVLSNKVQHHYWRGLIDSDGSIGFATSRNSYFLQLSGTKHICSSFSHFIGYNGDNVKPNRNIWSFACSGRERIHNCLSTLYKNANIYLDRKYKIYADISKNTTMLLFDLELS